MKLNMLHIPDHQRNLMPINPQSDTFLYSAHPPWQDNPGIVDGTYYYLIWDGFQITTDFVTISYQVT